MMRVDRQPVESLVGNILDGAYRLVELVGEGGMGAVYAAVQLRLNKRIAVKVMARELAANAEALARFRREAEVTSGLGHPHIVQVFDFGAMPTGEPYLVMEFMEGEDLDRRLRRVGRLSPHDTLHIVKQVAGALDTTHRKGIVHRDLKPANIYLLNVSGEPDFVKVLDFGISKVRTATTKLTKDAMVMGTPNYMSPEQALGQVDETDERTDQWALACIAWEAMSGKCPFVAECAPALLFQVVHEPPVPLPAELTSENPQLAAVLCRALAKDKNDRFANVIEFAGALEEAVGTTAAESTSATSRASAARSSASTSKARNIRQTGGAASPESGPSAARLGRSTLSQSLGEIDERDQPSARPSWLLPAVGGAVAIGLLGVLLLYKSGPTAPAAARNRPAAMTSPTEKPQPAAKPDAAVAAAPAVSMPGEETALGHEPSPVAAPPGVGLGEGKKASKKAKPAKPALIEEAKEISPAIPNCNPNFYLDSQGEKHFKRECFLNAH
jgi:serine/threonine protein kinase